MTERSVSTDSFGRLAIFEIAPPESVELGETFGAMVGGANGAVILCRRIAEPMRDIARSNAGRRVRAVGVRLD